MKFVTYEIAGKEFVGVLDGATDKIIPLAAYGREFAAEGCLPDTMVGVIQGGENVLAQVKQLTEWNGKDKVAVSLDAVRLLAPIPRPLKNILCVGKNYADHAKELALADSASVVPENPVFFTKAPTTVNAPGADVKSHSAITQGLDYEVELALIIGKNGINIPKEEAFDYIFGYTIMNDVTGRDLQNRHLQWFRGKSLDTCAPLGPWIVHRSALPNADKLDVCCKINGEVRQKSNTSKFIFDIPTLIATLSSGMTLEAGDIIATGTPAGVGAGFKPPRFLKAGDVMELEIEGIGILKNRIVD